jgi:hypothetical protein
MYLSFGSPARSAPNSHLTLKARFADARVTTRRGYRVSGR